MHLAWQLKFSPLLLIKEGDRGAEEKKEETDDNEKKKTKNRKQRQRLRRFRRMYDDLGLNSPINSDVKLPP